LEWELHGVQVEEFMYRTSSVILFSAFLLVPPTVAASLQRQTEELLGQPIRHWDESQAPLVDAFALWPRLRYEAGPMAAEKSTKTKRKSSKGASGGEVAHLRQLNDPRHERRYEGTTSAFAMPASSTPGNTAIRSMGRFSWTGSTPARSPRRTCAAGWRSCFRTSICSHGTF